MDADIFLSTFCFSLLPHNFPASQLTSKILVIKVERLQLSPQHSVLSLPLKGTQFPLLKQSAPSALPPLLSPQHSVLRPCPSAFIL